MRIRRIPLPASAGPVLHATYPIPAKWTFDLDECIYVNGGFGHGARYPDIIINKDDYDLIPKMPKSKIHAFIKKRFDVDNLILNDLSYTTLAPWSILFKKNTAKNRKTIKRKKEALQFDKRDLRLRKRIFNCKTYKQMYEKQKALNKSLTNVSALCHGDCREIGWYTAMMYNALNNGNYYVCYATLYVDVNGMMHYVMDHVFVIHKKNGILKAVDSIFDEIRSPNCFVLHEHPVKKINAIYFGNSLVLEVGDVYVDGKKMHKLVAVPKIYNGFISLIKQPPIKEGQVLVMNRAVDFDKACDLQANGRLED